MTEEYQRRRTEGGLERKVAIVAHIRVTFIVHRSINPTAVWLISAMVKQNFTSLDE